MFLSTKVMVLKIGLMLEITNEILKGLFEVTFPWIKLQKAYILFIYIVNND